jgi:hypothetical protein
MKPLFPVALAVLLLCSASWAEGISENPAQLRSLLRQFDENTAVFMNSLPIKSRLDSGNSRMKPKFPPAMIRNGSYIHIKNSSRPLSGRSAALDNDDPKLLVDNSSSLLTHLGQMDEKSLRSARLPSQPWSDFYWPLYAGSIAHRYADPKFPDSKDWKINSDYIWNPNTSSSLDLLSPAEKYDLLIGSSERSLTRAVLAEGELFYSSSGTVETWMGICHGWAAAAYMLPRPAKAIQVLAADGKTKISFYPSDIKALATLLWAKSPPISLMIGGRCDTKNPQKDPFGRIVDPNCNDNNPGSWHISVVNQIGISQRSFVLDATFDYEVWNQPAYSYRYSYFNPETQQPTSSLQEATVKLRSFTKDKFRNYRAPRANSVVGIVMDLTYMVETYPQVSQNDYPRYDATQTVSYVYDLELDSQGNIVGGEWYQNAHPDFLWTPPREARAMSSYDESLEHEGKNWNGKTSLPESWRNYAHRSADSGIPLAKIVETLVTLSQAGI